MISILGLNKVYKSFIKSIEFKAEIMELLHYDDEFTGKRISKNNNIISQAASGKLELKLMSIINFKTSHKGTGFEEMLSENFIPDSIIINGFSSESYPVIEYAMFRLNYNNLPYQKIIYLCPPVGYFPNLITRGVNCVFAHGGNGYLIEKDAQNIINILLNLKK